MSSSIYFYGTKGEYGFLSNFYKSTFTSTFNNLDILVEFKCNEQYFCYVKCLTFDPSNKKMLETILQENNPVKIKRLSRQIKNFDIEEWNKKKYNVMLNGLKDKFINNPDLKHKLINTNNSILYEAAPRDKIWGIGYSASNAININPNLYGKNLLGKALMEVRTILQNM